jgi:peptidoglycan/xylan/chitin deacetylase (PgdA/CDA1 family)
MLMRALLYHDVAPRSEWGTTGFHGGDAAVYKLEGAAFDAHLAKLATIGRPPALVSDASSNAWLLTFDDGGASAMTHTAPALEARNWRGHFFMTVGQLGTPEFLDAAALRDLRRRGHVIGSHTVSHPLRMSSCSPAELRREWADSVEALADILGERPTIASVPGGAFARVVAETAAEAGIRVLFTSEPTARTWHVGPVRCVGRFTIWNGMPADAAHGFATGRGLWPIRQRLAWDAKKLAKATLGPAYLRVRKRVLDRRAALEGSRVE